MSNILFGGQISPEHIPLLKEKGVTLIVCNRPNNEEPGQPCFEDIEKAANEEGIKTLYMPISSQGDTIKYSLDFKEQVLKTKGVAFAYCRSGARSQSLARLTNIS